MAVYQVQYIQHATTGLPEDDTVHTLHFSSTEGSPSGSVASDLAGAVAAAHYDAGGVGNYLEGYTSSRVSRVTPPTIKVYDRLAPGSPLAVEEQAAFRPVGNATPLPEEVALCLSFRGDYGFRLEEAADDADADSAPERPRSRVRGRVYLGPWAAHAIEDSGAVGRPESGLITAMLDYAEKLHDIKDIAFASAVNMLWGIYSPEESDFTPAERAWVDNAWDTQRRRGLAATVRTEQVFT